ncbi:Uncharacterised protein [uncultured archaeon]|nr:Uncharacterised protein [uncultured archaeon]
MKQSERLEKDYFQDMKTEIANLITFTKGITTYEAFKGDQKTVYACLRSIEVIGEAAKCISPETKLKYPGVEWRKIAGARDVIVHNYAGVDLRVIWETIQTSIPLLKTQVDSILKEL